MASKTWIFGTYAMAEGALNYAENEMVEACGLQEKNCQYDDQNRKVVELYNPDENPDAVVCRLILSPANAQKHMFTVESTYRSAKRFFEVAGSQCAFFEGKEDTPTSQWLA
jgi:hypothetical protein